MALDVDAVEVDPSRAYNIVGVLNRGRGLLYREPMKGSDTAYKTLNRIRPSQVVYSRLKAFEGAITVAPAALDESYASQEFPTFTCGPSLMPEYFNLLTTTKRLWDTLQNLSTGMGGRRERVRPGDFLTIKIALPSLPEQRRIVDFVKSVDAHIAALSDEAEKAAVMTRAVRTHVLVGEDWPLVPLVDLTTKIGSGATPRGGESAYVHEGIALVRSQNVYDLAFKWSGLVRITDAQAQLLDGVTVESGDVLINITGASVNRACVVPDAVLPARVNQHVAILRPEMDKISSDLLVHLLRRDDIKNRLDVMANSGSTRQAITKAQLMRFKIPVPPPDEHNRLTASLNALVAVTEGRTGELNRIRSLRSTLLTVLLNQEVTMPDSYGALLEGVS